MLSLYPNAFFWDRNDGGDGDSVGLPCSSGVRLYEMATFAPQDTKGREDWFGETTS